VAFGELKGHFVEIRQQNKSAALTVGDEVDSAWADSNERRGSGGLSMRGPGYPGHLISDFFIGNQNFNVALNRGENEKFRSQISTRYS
jgi:hypothetical protein